MVPWLPELKLCWEMGTNPGRVIFYVPTGYSNPQGQGAIKSMHPKLCVVCPVRMLQRAWTGTLQRAVALQRAGALQQVLRMHRAKPGTPASSNIKDFL